MSWSDALREAANVATYPALGHRLRRRGFRDADLDVDLRGQVHVVTGGSAGIGLAIARGLAARGATVVIVARGQERAQEAAQVMKAAGGRVEIELADLACLASVRALAARITARHPRVHALVDNAGVVLWDRRTSADGHELTFATNVLGPFALTCLFAPALSRAPNGRVVHVCSAAIYGQRLDVDALLTGGAPYRGALQYARTKRAQAELSALFTARLAERGVTSAAMHPGLTATPGTAESFPIYHRVFAPILRDPGAGADTAVWLAASPAARGKSAELWFDRAPHPAHVVPWTRAPRGEAPRLFAACAALVGIDEATLELER